MKIVSLAVIIANVYGSFGLNLGFNFQAAFFDKRLDSNFATGANGTNSANGTTVEYPNLLDVRSWFQINIGSNQEKAYVVLELESPQIQILQKNNTFYAYPGEDLDPDYIFSISDGVSYTTTASKTRESVAYATDESDTFESTEELFEYYHPHHNFGFNKGVLGYDSVFMNGMEIKNVSIAVITDTNVGGVFGLGLPLNEGSFLSRLKSQEKIEKLVYSLSLEDEDASILFGAIDHMNYNGPLVTIPMRHDSTGEINSIEVTLSSIEANGSTLMNIKTSNYTTKFATNSEVNFVPVPILNELIEAFNATYSADVNFYVVPCDTEASLKLDFDGATLTASDGIIQDSNEEYCFLNFFPATDNIIRLGLTLLNQGYFVFDLEDYEVSIAELNLYRSEKDIETIYSTVPSATRVSGLGSVSSRNISSTSVSMSSELQGSDSTSITSMTSDSPGSDSTASPSSPVSTTSAASTIKINHDLNVAIILALFAFSFVNIQF